VSNQNKTRCYLGRRPCGCAAALIVVDGQWSMVVAKTIGAWARRGWTVEFVTVAEACFHLEVVCGHDEDGRWQE